MKNTIDEVLKSFESALEKISDLEGLKKLQNDFLGKKGELSQIFKNFKDLTNEERKEAGELANVAKNKIQGFLDQKSETFEAKAREINFDPTLPFSPNIKIKNVFNYTAARHPILKLMEDLNQAFLSLGFKVYEGPQITSEKFAFDSLNFPENHPARESMDTYWLNFDDKESKENFKNERLCLRPHLTGGSVRFLKENKPPVKFVYPGAVFRNESTDASHERAFFQYEALIVDKEVPFSSVRVLVNTILERVFGQKVKTRMRSGFFPFVEPGFEIDMECLVCKSKGCSVCSQSGWIEVMPGGPPHPNVLRAADINPEEWQGAYLNIGLDRLVMMKYQIDDVRLFHSGDIRFFEQF
jgi:phenylalanyl-tRNA synthetase alpha chain